MDNFLIIPLRSELSGLHQWEKGHSAHTETILVNEYYAGIVRDIEWWLSIEPSRRRAYDALIISTSTLRNLHIRYEPGTTIVGELELTQLYDPMYWRFSILTSGPISANSGLVIVCRGTGCSPSVTIRSRGNFRPRFCILYSRWQRTLTSGDGMYMPDITIHTSKN